MTHSRLHYLLWQLGRSHARAILRGRVVWVRLARVESRPLLWHALLRTLHRLCNSTEKLLQCMHTCARTVQYLAGQAAHLAAALAASMCLAVCCQLTFPADSGQRDSHPPGVPTRSEDTAASLSSQRLWSDHLHSAAFHWLKSAHCTDESGTEWSSNLSLGAWLLARPCTDDHWMY